MARWAISTLVLAALAPWLYDRAQMLSAVIANTLERNPPIYNIKNHEVNFRDRIRNCEDVLLDEAMGIAILSCDPGRDRWNTVMGTFHADENLQSGRLWLYDYSTPGLAKEDMIKPLTFKDFPNENDFHPLGLELESETSTLYAVSHAQSGSAIEIFKLEIKTATLTHVQTYRHPLIHAPNSIHSLGGGKLYVTNDHMFRAAVSPLLAKIETFSGLSGGTVVYTDINEPSATKIVARVAFANGIAMLNSTTLAVASSTKPGIYLYEPQPDYTLRPLTWFRTPVAVDNISVDSSGTLLMAGHPTVFALMKVSKGRPRCNLQSQDEADRKACECTAPSWVAKWTEGAGVTTLFMGNDFCSSTMLVRDVTRGISFVSGLYERGVMVVRE